MHLDPTSRYSLNGFLHYNPPPPKKVMNVTAREGIFIPCCVYIPAEPPLMGLESLKMCFSWPGKLLAGRMCRDLCIFDAAWGGVEL